MTGFSTDPRGLSRLEKIEQALLSVFSAGGFLTTSGADATGDLIFQTGTPPVERARIKADGTGSGLIGGAVAARVYRSTNQSVPGNNVAAYMSYDTVRFDTGGFFSLSNPTRLTAPKDGVYLIGANAVTDPPSSTNARFYLSLQINETTNPVNTVLHPPVGSDTLIHRPVGFAETVWKMTAGDYCEVQVTADYGVANTNVSASGPQGSEFWIYLIGA